MSDPLLVLDCNYLCHRAYHTSGASLSFGGKVTGIIFGFFKSVIYFKDEFQTDRVVFCFDSTTLKRRELYPGYKRKRHTKPRTAEETAIYRELAVQIAALRLNYLPKIGFQNVFCFHGLESDDIMAVLAQQASDDEEVILVTSDMDLLQCLRHNVSIYSPQKNKLLTQNWFRKTYGIPTSQWARVKSMAGCHSDEIEGIRGVGEATALKYLRGELKENSVAYRAIRSPEGRAIVQRNRALVELPFAGCPEPWIKKDCVTREAWVSVCETLGMKSIAGRPPVATKTLLTYGKRS